MNPREEDAAAGRRRRSDGRRTHAAILEVATRIASVEGIYGLSIGRLADALDVSKSGLWAHFGSKEQLQLETVEAAQSVFDDEVMRPALEAPDGLKRLEALCAAYLSYVERRVFPGGCFFASLLAEMDGRAGAMHDAVVAGERRWVENLAQLARVAQEHGEIAADIDVHQLAFELHAGLELANYHFVLFDDAGEVDRGRRAVAATLERARRANPRA